MTGRLVYVPDGAAPEYAYVRLHLQGGGMLALVVPRKFGRIGLVDDPDAFIAEKDLGPDALRIDRPDFEGVLDRRRGMIKTAFLDQSVLAGLGNIYADEILFQVGVHPRTKIADLDAETRHALFDAMKEVLHVAIQHDADPDALPADRYMLPHRRGDNRDPLSGGEMQTLTVGGRTAYFSPSRQPPPGS
jgi:formamidopyrimidine-DNA glycosylase